jgi:hypothetical protein
VERLREWRRLWLCLHEAGSFVCYGGGWSGLQVGKGAGGRCSDEDSVATEKATHSRCWVAAEEHLRRRSSAPASTGEHARRGSFFMYGYDALALFHIPCPWKHVFQMIQLVCCGQSIYVFFRSTSSSRVVRAGAVNRYGQKDCCVLLFSPHLPAERVRVCVTNR